MNDRKALILATLIERGRLKEAEIVKITSIPRSPVRRYLEGLEPLTYRDAEHYWNVQKGTKVAVLQTPQPPGPIAAAGRDLGFLREWWLDRKARHLAEVSARVRYRKERDAFNDVRWRWEAYHAAPAIARAISRTTGRKHQVKVSRPRNPTPPRPILKEIYFEEYREWRREMLGQGSEPAT